MNVYAVTMSTRVEDEVWDELALFANREDAITLVAEVTWQMRIDALNDGWKIEIDKPDDFAAYDIDDEAHNHYYVVVTEHPVQ